MIDNQDDKKDLANNSGLTPDKKAELDAIVDALATEQDETLVVDTDALSDENVTDSEIPPWVNQEIPIEAYEVDADLDTSSNDDFEAPIEPATEVPSDILDGDEVMVDLNTPEDEDVRAKQSVNRANIMASMTETYTLDLQDFSSHLFCSERIQVSILTSTQHGVILRSPLGP